jgi:hypothetical protein
MNKLQITTRIGCRVACTYCPQDLLVQTYLTRSHCRELRFDQYTTFLEKLPKNVEVWFGGMCEPWLNSDCTRMALHTHRKGHIVSAYTTLVGMRATDVKALEPIPFGFFRVHLPSASGTENIPTDDVYMETLSMLLNSRLNYSFHCHDTAVQPKVAEVLKAAGQSIWFGPTFRRSGNLRGKHWLRLPRRRGRIICKRQQINNVLLPNGDVLLCSNDYGQQHILGNLNEMDYDSLFTGSEYRQVQAGLKDSSLGTLCRHCEEFCENADTWAELLNGAYLIDKAWVQARRFRSIADWLSFGRRMTAKLTKIARLHPE